jgi:hypothetical protein
LLGALLQPASTAIVAALSLHNPSSWLLANMSVHTADFIVAAAGRYVP